MQKSERVNFGSKIGAVLAAAGSAVGLGNIWNHVIWGGIIAPVAMSGCIELMQAYCTDTRSGDWLDFLANSIGVGLAALIGYYLLRPLIWRKS